MVTSIVQSKILMDYLLAILSGACNCHAGHAYISQPAFVRVVGSAQPLTDVALCPWSLLTYMMDCCRESSTRVTLLEAADSFFAYDPILKALQASSEASLPFGDLLKYTGSTKVNAHAKLVVAVPAKLHTAVCLTILPC